jgi:hypothetical protein
MSLSTVDIANTIRDQIGIRNIMCFGVPPRTMMALPPNEFRHGGLYFRFTNCPKIRHGSVMVELMGDDTYTVTIKNQRDTVKYKGDGIYCDMLFDVLDEHIG